MTTTETAPEQTPASPETPTLSGVNISVRFGGVTAVDNVSIDAYAGRILGLMGPNGAGKTTLFDALSGIRPPSEGRVIFEGADVTRRSPTWRSRHGMRRTFQRQQMFGWLTVEENVLVALEWRGGGGGLLADLVAMPTRKKREKQRRAASDRVLEICGLVELRNEPAGKLPIGRARMVEMARAIVDEPKVLLLDEPTSGIETSDTEALGSAMRQVAADGAAVILVEHDVGFMMEHCDRIVALQLGAILAEGTPEEIRQNRAVRDAYLG